jgi:5-methylcytosine-specific restriction endonuclease McrA
MPRRRSKEQRAGERAYNRAYKASHKEDIRRQTRAYRAAHREQIRRQTRAYKVAHKEELAAKRRVYVAANKEKIAAQRRAYVATNKEKIAARTRAYKVAHRSEIRVQERAYKAAHPDLVAATRARRKAREAKASVNDLTAAQWEEIKAAYGHRCVYCGRKMQRLTKDHIVPLAKGGTHTFSNVVPACLSCNSKKGARAPLIPVQPLLLTIASSCSAQESVKPASCVSTRSKRCSNS